MRPSTPGDATMLGRVRWTRQHLVLESPSGTTSSSASTLLVVRDDGGRETVTVYDAEQLPPPTR